MPPQINVDRDSRFSIPLRGAPGVPPAAAVLVCVRPDSGDRIFQIQLKRDSGGSLRLGKTPGEADPPAAKTAQAVEAEFRRLARLWKKEVGHLSSTSRMARHPAYQEIIGIGHAVV